MTIGYTSRQKKFINIIYIDKDPDKLWKGWGWVDLEDEVVKKYNIDAIHPGHRIVKPEEISNLRDRKSFLFGRSHSDYGYIIKPPRRGRTGGKKFILQIGDENISFKAQKVLTNKAVVAWVKTWCPQGTKIVTPGGKTLSSEGKIESHNTEFVYFVFNEKSNAIKIGRAKDVEKRLFSLQTASPDKLKIIKTIRVNGTQEAKELEKKLHQQFNHLRLSGEWFKAECELLEFEGLTLLSPE